MKWKAPAKDDKAADRFDELVAATAGGDMEAAGVLFKALERARMYAWRKHGRQSYPPAGLDIGDFDSECFSEMLKAAKAYNKENRAGYNSGFWPYAMTAFMRGTRHAPRVFFAQGANRPYTTLPHDLHKAYNLTVGITALNPAYASQAAPGDPLDGLDDLLFASGKAPLPDELEGMDVNTLRKALRHHGDRIRSPAGKQAFEFRFLGMHPEKESASAIAREHGVSHQAVVESLRKTIKNMRADPFLRHCAQLWGVL